MKNYFIDIHSHPSLKPFGQSFKFNNPQTRNSKNRNQLNSIYHRSGINPVKKKSIT